jgi:hypothetical protein
MKARLALALLAAVVTAVPASGGANRGEEQRSRQPHGPGRVPPGFPVPPPAAPDGAHVPDVWPPSYGSPGGFLPLPYHRPLSRRPRYLKLQSL